MDVIICYTSMTTTALITLHTLHLNLLDESTPNKNRTNLSTLTWAIWGLDEWSCASEDMSCRWWSALPSRWGEMAAAAFRPEAPGTAVHTDNIPWWCSSTAPACIRLCGGQKQVHIERITIIYVRRVAPFVLAFLRSVASFRKMQTNLKRNARY